MINSIFMTRNPIVNWQLINNKRLGALLFYSNGKESHFIKFNKIAALIWCLSNGEFTQEAIVHRLIKKFNLNSSQRKQCKEFIDKLIKLGLLIKLNHIKKDNFGLYVFNKIKHFNKPKIISHYKKRLSFNSQNWHSDFTSFFREKNQLYYPHKVNFDITYKCNLSCRHCYYYSNNFKQKRSKDPSLSKVKKIIDKIDEAHIKIIHFLGGEPFMRKDIFEIIEYARKKGLKVVVNTNGTLLNEEKLSKLRDLDCSLNISIDGGCAKTHELIRGKGNFERIIKNIKLAVRYGINVQLNSVINRLNFKELPNIIVLANKLKIRNLTISPALSIGEGLKSQAQMLTGIHWDRYLIYRFILQATRLFKGKKLRTNVHFLKCDAFTYTHINPEGDVNYCVKMPNSFSQGNVLKEGLIKIWHSKRYQELFNLNNIKEPCKSCLFKKTCRKIRERVPCRAAIYATTGDFFTGDARCFRGKISMKLNSFIRIV